MKIYSLLFACIFISFPSILSADQHQTPTENDNWRDQFQKHFYIGFEGTSVSGFDERGTARVGALIHNVLGRNEDLQTNDNWRIKDTETHFYGNWLLTTSAEQSSLKDGINPQNTGTAGTTATDSTIEPAFEASLGIFKPIYFSNKSDMTGRDHEFLFGPVVDFTLRKPDNLNKYSKKNYAGIRMTHGPQAYFDILVGKTNGIKGQRLELRAQTPLSSVSTGTVFAGVIVNFGIKDAPEDADSLRLYISWHYDLNKWMKSLAPEPQ